MADYLEGIDEEMRNRIATKLKEYAKKPLRYARKLISPEIGTYRFKIGLQPDRRSLSAIGHW